MTDSDQDRWIVRNQELLAAEFSRLKRLLSGSVPDPKETEEAAGTEATTPPTLASLGSLFGLTPFERSVLLLAAGVEMDAELARLCGEALGRPDCPWATFGLALSLLPEPHWSALTPAGPLRRWRLVEIERPPNVSSARLTIDERILHFLAGISYLDTRLHPFLRTLRAPDLMSDDHRILAGRIAEGIVQEDPGPSLVLLEGDDPSGKEDVAARTASALGLKLFAISHENLPSEAVELGALATLWQREAALSGSALLIDLHGAEAPRRTRSFVRGMNGIVFVSAPQRVGLTGDEAVFAVNKPLPPDQRRLWLTALGNAGRALDGDLDGVAAQYRLSARAIGTAAARAALDGARSGGLLPALRRACRGASGANLGALARRIEPAAGWDDLVLPKAQLSILRQIASHVRNRLRVYHDWGFAARSSRGTGISALFTGESGTGKTMAAEVLAKELDLDLNVIDLSGAVSKYIGETEKNLRRIFDSAEESGAILLFDEADALFGKRSEVRDSHDRYANIEVSYLLQRMEAYRGLAILTTNQKSALDTAFQRRLRFTVCFPFPDRTQREAIWRGIFPPETPLNGIDFTKLACLNAAGGSIRSIALNAAFLAAEERRAVGMDHLLRCAHAEASKRDHTVTSAEIKGWV